MPYNTFLSLDDANIPASPSSQNEKTNDPTAPLRNETWLLPDGNPGIWDIELDYRFTPSRMMLRNPPIDNSTVKQYGTKSFSFATVPEDASGGTVGFEFTYRIDEPGHLSETAGNCTGSCDLQPDNVWTEFTFQKNFSISAFRLVIAEWYGNAGGLNGLQLYGHIDERHVGNDTSTVANGTESAAPSPSQQQSSSAGLSGGAIAGVVVACVAALSFLAVGGWFLRRKRRQARTPEIPKKVADDEEAFAPTGGRHELDTTSYDMAKHATEADGGQVVEMEALQGKTQAKEMAVEGSTVHEMPAEVRTAEMNGQSVVPEMDAGLASKSGERK